MYFFYINESGTKDPTTSCTKTDGTVVEKDWLYILFAISLYEGRWQKFDGEICDRKMRLIHRVSDAVNERFDLADAEVHSTVVRIEKERSRNRFFKHLQPADITFLLESFYNAVERHFMNCFAVIVDKRVLRPAARKTSSTRRPMKYFLRGSSISSAITTPSKRG